MKSTYFFALIIALVLPAAALAAPSGAVKLSAKKMYRNSGVQCGKVKKRWVAGKKLAGGYFYPISAERKNTLAEAKRASGKTKKKLQKKAKSLKSLQGVRDPICVDGKRLKFNLTNAVGLALNTTSSSSLASTRTRRVGTRAIPSNLKKVTNTGSLEEVISASNVEVSKILVNPNGKIHVLFTQKTNIDDPEEDSATQACFLAEVDQSTGEPTCIENELYSLFGWNDGPFSSWGVNDPIQYDSDGGIYYAGVHINGDRVLRKYVNGQKTDLISDNVTLFDFLVLPDGRLIASGHTSSNNSYWMRRIDINGSLKNLGTFFSPSYMTLLPDGNVFTNDAYQYLTSSDAMDPERYWGDGWVYNRIKLHTTSDNRVFKVNNYPIKQIYPLVAMSSLSDESDVAHLIHTPSVTQVSASASVGDKLALAGTNAQNQNIFVLYDVGDRSEIELIGSSNEIEIYRLAYRATDNRVMFDGLQFSTNKYVIGSVDLDTLELTVSQTGSNKLEDFKALTQ